MPRLPITPSAQLDQGGGYGRYTAPGVTAQRDFTGAQLNELGDEVQRAGAVVTHAGLVERDNYVDIRAREGLNRLMEMAVTTSQKHGTLKEKNAVDGFEPMWRDLSDQRDKLQDGMDPEVLKVFGPAADREMLQTKLSMQGHAEREGTSWRIGETDTAAKAHGLKFGLLATQNPKEAEKEKAISLRYQDELASLHGWGPEQAQDERLGRTTAMHEQVVRDLTTRGFGSQAGEWLEQHAAEISPERAGVLQDLTQRATASQEGAQLADLLTASGQPLLTNIATARQMYEEGKVSLEVRDTAVARMRSEDAEKFEQETKARVASLTKAQDFAMQNRAAVKGYNELPAAMQQDLERTGAADKMKLFYENGAQWITTSEGIRALATATPERLLAFKSKDQLHDHFRGMLSDNDLLHMGAKWDDAQEQAGRAQAAASKSPFGAGDFNDEIRTAMADAGQLPIATGQSKPSKDDAENEGRVEAERYRRVESAIHKEAMRLGGEKWLSPEIRAKAIATEMGKIIEDEAGKRRVLSSMNLGEMNKPGVGWTTAYGHVDNAAVTPQAQSDAVREIALENQAIRERNAMLPPGAQHPLQEVTPQTIAEAIGKKQSETKTAIDQAIKRSGWRGSLSPSTYYKLGYRATKDAAEETIMEELRQKGFAATLEQVRARMP